MQFYTQLTVSYSAASLSYNICIRLNPAKRLTLVVWESTGWKCSYYGCDNSLKLNYSNSKLFTSKYPACQLIDSIALMSFWWFHKQSHMVTTKSQQFMWRRDWERYHIMRAIFCPFLFIYFLYTKRRHSSGFAAVKFQSLTDLSFLTGYILCTDSVTMSKMSWKMINPIHPLYFAYPPFSPALTAG